MHGETNQKQVESNTLLTAMVVDDSGTLRAAINRFMQATGFVESVVEAVDGFDAIKVLGSAPIDIIICDVMMPGCDGLQFLQMKSKYPEYKDIPVIMLTSEDDAETVVACIEAGASDHIRKPIQKDEFVARLRVHCGLKQRQGELIAVSEQLSDSRAFLDNIINSLTDGLVVIDKDEKIVQCNESILSLLGFVSSKPIIGSPIQQLIAEDDLLWMLGFSQLLRQGPFTGMSARFLHQNGKQVTMSVSASQIQGDMAKKTFSIVLLRNIQEAQDLLAYESRELAEEKESKSQFSELRFQIRELRTKLEDQSFHDSLTGIWNRRYLYESISRYISDIHRAYYGETFETGETPCATFLILDLDHFKQANDTFGHAVGDQILRETARRLQAVARESDIVVRWGDEEFLVIGRNMTHGGVKQFVQRVQDSFRQNPFKVEGDREINLTSSIGVAAYPFVREKYEALSWEDVFVAADQALHIAKLSGRNQWVGLAGNSKTSIKQFRKNLSNVLPELLDKGELEIECEKGDPQDLKWTE